MREVVFCSIEMAGDRKTLVFTVSVAQAHGVADVLNRHRAGSAAAVDGKTPADERARLFHEYGAGRLQHLVNVGIATEGWDDPSTDRPIEIVAVARPTKSRSLYAQMIGRGTRPLPGLVDPLRDADHRRAAIAGSIKPALMVMDYAGNAGKH